MLAQEDPEAAAKKKKARNTAETPHFAWFWGCRGGRGGEGVLFEGLGGGGRPLGHTSGGGEGGGGHADGDGGEAFGGLRGDAGAAGVGRDAAAGRHEEEEGAMGAPGMGGGGVLEVL